MSLFFKRKPPSAEDVRTLIEILRCCREFVEKSEDSPWSHMEAPEIDCVIANAIERLEQDSAIDHFQLRMIFGPTGPLQETSMSNGWSDEYLALAAKFDHAIQPWLD
jgi:hypothetical protein